MEKKLKAAASGGPMNEAYSAEGPNHPLIPKLREIAAANELEKNALDALQDKIRAYETSFEELKVGRRRGNTSTELINDAARE
jgi:hypothetical protein